MPLTVPRWWPSLPTMSQPTFRSVIRICDRSPYCSAATTLVESRAGDEGVSVRAGRLERWECEQRDQPIQGRRVALDPGGPGGDGLARSEPVRQEPMEGVVFGRDRRVR